MGTWEQDSPPTPRLPEYSSRIYVLDSYYPWLRREEYFYNIYTLHANLWIHGRKRTRLERLFRYVARGAIVPPRLL